MKFGKLIGRAIEELITIVSPSTFYRWVRDEKKGKPKPKNPKGGQRKPKEILRFRRRVQIKAEKASKTLRNMDVTRIL